MEMKQRMKWFNEARFGMFIHWGVYSLLGRGEWVMYRDRIPPEEYAKLADHFNPTHFDADAWSQLAVDAGMKYVVLTTRHHDGFCLFDSKVSDFTSVKTAARRDFIADYVESCRKYNLRVGLYYSLGDWRFGIPKESDSPEGAEKMLNQAHNQVRELLTNYGKIDLLWYDGGWCYPSLPDDGTAEQAKYWQSEKLNAMVRELQPEIIINDRSGLPADYSTPEGHVSKPKDPDRSWETCMTMSGDENSYWGFLRHDSSHKSTGQLLRFLALAACNGGNFLLNIGPDANGIVPQFALERLKNIGDWMKLNGDAIYNSETCDKFLGGSAGNLSQKGDTVYYHMFRWPGQEAIIPKINVKILDAKVLASDETVEFTQEESGRVTLHNLPLNPPDPYNTVIAIKIAT